MKKILSLLLVVVMVFGVCGCGKKEIKLTVTDKEGTVSEMTVSELYEAKQNQAQFNKLYNGAKVSFTGTVKKIETNYRINDSPVYDSITFEENLTLYTDHQTNVMGMSLDLTAFGFSESIYDYSTINIGDKLTVNGGKISTFPDSISIVTCETLTKAE